MKKKVNSLVIIFIISLIIFSIAAYFYIFQTQKIPVDNKISSKKLLNETKNPDIMNISENNDSIESKKNSSPAGGGGGGSSGNSAGGGSDSTSTTNPVNAKELPKDVDTKPCGFYAGTYEVCGGYCPEGECVAEGRSCYCRK